MGLKIWLAVASMLMVLDIAYGAASTADCPAAVVKGKMTCTCKTGGSDAATGPVVWTFDGQTPTGTGNHKQTLVKTSVTKANEDNKKVKCKYPASGDSAEITTKVEAPLAPKITCTPAPTKLGVETTCTCAKAAAQTAEPDNCKLKIGSGADLAAAACDALKYTPQTADNGKKITCKAVFPGPVDSPASTTEVVTITYTKQTKPSIEGAKQDATADVTLTCKPADSTEKLLTYKWFKDGSTTAIPNEAGSTLKVKQCDATKDKVYTYTCMVTNGAGDSPASDGAKVKFTAAATNCPTTTAKPGSAGGIRPSLILLGFILLLTTILLKQ